MEKGGGKGGSPAHQLFTDRVSICTSAGESVLLL